MFRAGDSTSTDELFCKMKYPNPIIAFALVVSLLTACSKSTPASPQDERKIEQERRQTEDQRRHVEDERRRVEDENRRIEDERRRAIDERWRAEDEASRTGIKANTGAAPSFK